MRAIILAGAFASAGVMGAVAAEHPQEAVRLKLNRNEVTLTSRLTWIAKAAAPAVPFTPPTVAGATLVLTAADGATSGSTVLAATGWEASPDGTLFKFRNRTAPDDVSLVKVAKLRGQVLKVVARHGLLDMASSLGAVSAVLIIGDDIYCSACTAPSIDEPDKFVARQCAAPGGCASAYEPCGVFQTAWGSTGSAPGQFRQPQALATNAAGDVYVADTYNGRVQKFAADGTFVTAWGSTGGNTGQFLLPTGVTVDGSGNVYVADSSERIQKFTGDGTFITAWGAPGLNPGEFDGLVGLATDSSGNVYSVENGNDRVQVFAGDGTPITSWGSSGTGQGQFLVPAALATDASANVYVVDMSRNDVQKFTSAGTFVTAWGSTGSGSGAFSFPRGVAVDSDENVYVADGGNNRVQRFTASGTFLGAWGSFGPGLGTFSLGTYGVAASGSGTVYVIDFTRVQAFACPQSP